MRLANLKQGADQFFTENEIVISVYNKLKHGIPIIRENESDHRVFQVLLFKNGVASARFEITPQMIRRLHRNTQAWSTALRDLAGLTKILFDGAILYEGAQEAEQAHSGDGYPPPLIGARCSLSAPSHQFE
jgi:hypothetical protein